MRKLLFLIVLLPFISKAQYKGIWNGYITRYDGGEISNYILDIKEQEDGLVKGDAYIFKKKYIVFEGKLNFVGIIKDNKLILKELKILSNKMPNKFTVLCLKNAELEIIPKFGYDNLTGRWNGKTFDYHDCDPGEVFLRRFIVDKPNGFEIIPDNILNSIKNLKTLPDTFLTTSLTLPKVVEVKSRFIQISIKDYEKVDGDIISVYLDRNQIIKDHELKKAPIVHRIRLDRTPSIGELIIYAENLGKIPPNTCLMIVDDGATQQEIYIESSLQKSAVIYFKYNPSD